MIPTINYDRKFLAKLKSNYINAKALYETIKQQSEDIQTKVLQENEFYESEKWSEMMEKRGGNGNRERIIRPFDTFLMEDVDFQKYLDLIYAEYLKAGIADKRGRDYVPEAESGDLYRETTKQLVEYGIDIIPDAFGEKETLRKAVQNIKWRDKVLDLVLKLECDPIENYLTGGKIDDRVNANVD